MEFLIESDTSRLWGRNVRFEVQIVHNVCCYCEDS